jgi:predicted XRE-type DNA-binding protein
MDEKLAIDYDYESAFHALKLEDADDLVVRSDLMQRISTIIAKRKLTQVQAAKILGMDQPRVSALLNGKITRFSTDRLLKALNDLGLDVELRIRQAKTDKGHTMVKAA